MDSSRISNTKNSHRKKPQQEKQHLSRALSLKKQQVHNKKYDQLMKLVKQKNTIISNLTQVNKEMWERNCYTEKKLKNIIQDFECYKAKMTVKKSRRNMVPIQQYQKILKKKLNFQQNINKQKEQISQLQQTKAILKCQIEFIKSQLLQLQCHIADQQEYILHLQNILKSKIQRIISEHFQKYREQMQLEIPQPQSLNNSLSYSSEIEQQDYSIDETYIQSVSERSVDQNNRQEEVVIDDRMEQRQSIVSDIYEQQQIFKKMILDKIKQSFVKKHNQIVNSQRPTKTTFKMWLPPI